MIFTNLVKKKWVPTVGSALRASFYFDRLRREPTVAAYGEKQIQQNLIQNLTNLYSLRIGLILSVLICSIRVRFLFNSCSLFISCRFLGSFLEVLKYYCIFAHRKSRSMHNRKLIDPLPDPFRPFTDHQHGQRVITVSS